MVMHARKRPRPSDGYLDRNDVNETEDRYGVRHLDRKFYDKPNRENRLPSLDSQSGPRLGRKLPFTDRDDRYHRDVDRRLDDDRYRRSGSREQRHDYHINSKERSSAVDDRNHTSRDTSYRPKDKAVQKSNTKQISSNKSQSGRDQRAEVTQKTPVRVCGDWSEHISSSGKRYFYNCKTEVSQWVKPKEWTAEDRDGRGPSSHNGPAGNRNGVSKTANSRLSGNALHRDESSNSNAADIYSSQRSDHERIARVRRTSMQSDRSRSADPHNRPADTDSDSRQHSVTSSPSAYSSVDDTGASPVNNRELNGKQSSGDDMDISPDVSPRPANDSTTNGSSSIEKTRLTSRPDQSITHQSASAGGDQSSMWGQALQTLQTLQEVLTRRGTVNPTATDSPMSVASQSPRLSLHQSPAASVNSIAAAANSAASDDIVEAHSHRDTLSVDKSPCVSERSTEHQSVVSTSGAADSTNDASSAAFCVSLPSSLSTFYDPSLIGHISGWPAEQVELRANLVSNENQVLCGHHCGQLSAELKRDRSTVRISEVQSTLIEHRILFLKQQINELEAQDKSYSVPPT